ncbi:hypothetical protein KUCAC02_037314, partial [Chaenocephalus aceratus]
VDEGLRERDVKLSSIIGLGSDGASVMMGKRAGVGALLKRESAFCIQVHCVAHRAALAALDAAKAVDQVGVYKRTVFSVAVEGIKLNWPALVKELHEEAVGGNPQAKDILGQIQTYCFIAWTHALADVLPVMTKLNLVFQKEDVNLATIRPMVHGSVAALHTVEGFPRSRRREVSGRLPTWHVTHADDRSRQAF